MEEAARVPKILDRPARDPLCEQYRVRDASAKFYQSNDGGRSRVNIGRMQVLRKILWPAVGEKETLAPGVIAAAKGVIEVAYLAPLPARGEGLGWGVRARRVLTPCPLSG